MEEKMDGLGIILIVGLIIGGFYFIFGGEQEGILNDVDQCKEIVKTDDQFYNKIFTKFTCSYDKTDSGKNIGGLCYHPIFNDNGICTKVIMYEKESEIKCKDPKNGYVDVDTDKCYCRYGTTWNNTSATCKENAAY